MYRPILLVCAFLVSMSSAFDNTNHKPIEEYAAKAKEMWLQSRLGHQLAGRRLDEWECDDLGEYIRTIPWPTVEKCAITEDKRDKSKYNQFVPRLGRNLDDALNEKWTPYSLNSHGFITTRSQFAPRLGRKLPYTPRLGRESLPTW